jgi:hypothetical protein
MKMILILLTTFICFNSGAQSRLSDAELESKAREAIKLTFQAAVVKGNAWEQEIYQTIGALNNIVIDQPNSQALVTFDNEGLCSITVTLDLQYGFTQAAQGQSPVTSECVEL